MHSPKPFALLLGVLAACGSGTYVPYRYHPPTFIAGEACDSDAECGDGTCLTSYPGGMCTKSCSANSECGNDGVCVRFGDGEGTCKQRCTATRDCRDGYACADLTDVSYGFCHPSALVKAPIGASCEMNSDCTSNTCAAWGPDGYCSKSCQSSNDCSSASTCVADAIGGQDACLVKCEQPGAQSSCRSGYRCVALVGKSYGVCFADDSSNGGGAGGGSGSGGGAGGGTGGSTGTRCRTYPTSYLETITTTGAPTRTLMHTVTFDRSALKYTNTTSEAVITETYATLADFIDFADSSVLMRKGGPRTIQTTGVGSSATTTIGFDSQGRATSVVTQTVADGTVYELMHVTFTAWDVYGRTKAGTANYALPMPGERCIGLGVTHRYDDATRTYVAAYAGGTNESMLHLDNCAPHSETLMFDSRLIPTSVVLAKGAVLVSHSFTVYSTASVCM